MNRLSVFFGLVFSLAGCQGDYSIDLPYGYRFIKASAVEHVIVKNYQVIVPGDVVALGVNGKYIIGYSEKPKESIPTWSERFFIIDCAVDKARISMTKEEYEELLREYGLPMDLKLVRPNRLSRY